MRSSSPTLSLVSSLAAAALAIAPLSVASAAAPKATIVEPEDESAEGETPDEAAEGETPEGEGEAAEGETPEGEGEAAEGETPEGEGEAAEGENPDDVAAEGEGETAEGEGEGEGEGEAAEGEGEGDTPSYLPEEDDRPAEPRIANKPAKGKGLMIAGGTVAGVGLGLTVAFALMTRNCSFDGPLQCRLQNQDDFLIPMGGAALLTGTMLLAVGIGYHVRYKKWERWTPEDEKKAALIPVPTANRHGAGLAWTGRF